MKKFLLGISLLFLSVFSSAQNTTAITGTLTDSDSQTWNYATWSAKLIVPGGGSPRYIGGGPAPTSFTGTLSSSGVFSGSVGNNAAIIPYGTQWQFTLCSLTSAQCQTIGPFTIQGSTQNVGNYLSGFISAPRIHPASNDGKPLFVAAYNTTELVDPVQSSQYINTVSLLQYLWNGTWTAVSGGGGGATFTANAIQYALTASTSRAATGLDEANTACGYSVTSQANNCFLTTTVPTSPGGSNVVFGIGAGPNMSKGAGTGSQGDVIIGYNAGASVTTAREDVFIGNRAGVNITGQGGTNPDDMIFTIIGSNAGISLTNQGVAGVLVGQKAGESMTSSSNDVVVGTHGGDALVVSSGDTIIGAQTFGGGGIGAVNGLRTTVVGWDGMGSVPTSGSNTLTDDTCIGANCLGTTDASTGNGNYNTCIGSFCGNNNGTGNYNSYFGYSAGGVGGGPSITGTYNLCFGAQSCTHLSSGSLNAIFGVNGSVSTGSYNIVSGFGAGDALRTGNSNLVMGYHAGQNMGAAVSAAILLGNNAGQYAATNGEIAIGNNAANLATGSGNTVVGNNAMQGVTTGTGNTAIGDSACNNSTGADSGNVCIGVNAEITAGQTYGIEIGQGTCSVGFAACIFGNLFSDLTGNIYDKAIGASTSVLCTTTNGKLTNSGCVYTPSAGSTISTGTLGTNVTSVTCFSVNCSSTRGQLSVSVSGSTTSEQLFIITFTTAYSSTPVCNVFQGQGSTWFGIYPNSVTTSGISISNNNTIATAQSFLVQYQCQP